MLKVTKANVCAIILVARSVFATTSGISTHESSSCGRKARDSALIVPVDGKAEVR